MPHYHVGIEAKRRVHDKLALGLAHDRGQPARLSCVHEEEDDVMILDEILKTFKVRLDFVAIGEMVAHHRNRKRVTRRIDTWEYLGKCFGSSLSFLGTAFETVFMLK